MTQAVNILLVDDEPGMLRYIRTLLEVDEYTVETASTGEEALQRVQAGLRPDLVLMDLLMPGIDGLQTLEQLRQIQPGVKVVMLSCVSDTRKVVQAIRLGAHDYLTKPFQKAELDAVIDQCLGKNQQNYPGEVEEPVQQPAQHGRELASIPLSSRTRAQLFPLICWRANCSVTKRVRLPAPRMPSPANLSCAIKELFCSTRLERCLRSCRPSCCTSCRISSSRV